MGDAPAVQAGYLDWAVAGRPASGEEVSGDLVTVHVEGPRYVIAVIDGLGHGPDAAQAAKLALRTIEDHRTKPVAALLQMVHRALSHSRGAAATLAVVNGAAGSLEWMGVGNVEGVVVRRDRRARPRSHGVFLRGGVLGQQMPSLHQPGAIALEDGDRIAIATDGIRVDLVDSLESDLSEELLAAAILADHAVPTDDAALLVARYRTEATAGRSA